MLNRLLSLLIPMLAVAALSVEARADQPDFTAPRAKDVAPTGTLRASFLVRNPVQATVDPVSGTVGGMAAEFTRVAAAKLNVPYKLIALASSQAVIASVKSGESDIGFTAYNLIVTNEVDFSQSYALVHNTYLVRTESQFHKSEELDKPGRVIGVGMRDPVDFFLTRTLDQATLKRNDGSDSDAALRMLMAGEIDAYGANRQRLTLIAARTPGVRMLDDNFYTGEQAIIVAKGNGAHLEFVDRMIDELRVSGLIRRTIAGAGLIGVDVAPRTDKPR